MDNITMIKQLDFRNDSNNNFLFKEVTDNLVRRLKKRYLSNFRHSFF
jgi:hypothetical protein